MFERYDTEPMPWWQEPGVQAVCTTVCLGLSTIKFYRNPDLRWLARWNLAVVLALAWSSPSGSGEAFRHGPWRP